MVPGVRLVMFEILGRLACRARGIDADQVSSIDGQPAWFHLAGFEINRLRAERRAIQELEKIA